jgi:branched-chain amino acid transport system ATP-binding protein
VEQNYHLATRLADYVYVLSQGRVQFSGKTKALIDNEDVRGTYLSV